MLYASVVSVLAASLLVKDVAAGVTHRGHRGFHAKKDYVDVTVYVEDIDVVTVTEWVTVDWEDPATTTSEVVVPDVTPSASSSASSASSSTNPAPAPAPAQPTAPAQPAVAPVVIAAATAPVVQQSVPAAPAVLLQSSAPAAVVAPVVVPTTLVPVVKSSSPPAASSDAPSSVSGGKRGLPYNLAALLVPFVGSKKISWAYNWASHPDGLTALNTGFEFVPMLWGTGSNFVNRWTKDADAAIASGSKHFFSFNEPDHPDQANLGAAAAAAAYKTYMQPYAGKVKLGAPAVTNGAKRADGGPMGLAYMADFLAACSGCTIDFVNVHWYDSALNVEYFKSFIQDAYTKGGNRKVWLTEFGATGTDAQIATFMQTVLPWMDNLGYVERYSYFFAATGHLLSSSTALSAIGSAYVAA